MPLYEYVCPGCGKAEERFVPVEERDTHLHFCGVARCMGLMTRRLTPPAVHTETGAKP